MADPSPGRYESGDSIKGQSYMICACYIYANGCLLKGYFCPTTDFVTGYFPSDFTTLPMERTYNFPMGCTYTI